MASGKIVTTFLVFSLISLVTANAQAGLFLIDFGDPEGSAAGWDSFGFPSFPGPGPTSVGPTPLTDWSAMGDNDVTAEITSTAPDGIGDNNRGATGSATTIDGIAVPIAARDDYFFNNNPGFDILVELRNLDPGLYNVSVFEGRTTDSNGQFGTIWAGSLGDEPGGTNTGNYAGSFATRTISIGAADSLFFRQADDFDGGTSGLIVRQTQAVPEPSTLFLLGTGLVGLVARRRR